MARGMLVALATLTAAGCGSNGMNHSAPFPASRAPIELKDAPCFSAPQPALDLADGESPWLASVTATLAHDLPDYLTPVVVSTQHNDSADHYDFRFVTADGVPACNLVAAAHLVRGQSLVSGVTPGRTWASAPDAALVWEDADTTWNAAARALGFDPATTVGGKAARCVEVTGAAVEPAWELDGMMGGHPFHVVGNSGRFVKIQNRGEPLSTGTAQAFDTGPADGSLLTVDLKDLDDGPRLKSTRFTTVLDTNIQPASSPEHAWIYDPSDVRFVETSLFVHVEQMAAWFSEPQHHYSFNCLPINIHAHTIFTDWGGDTTVNNAMYTGPEATADGQPMIQVGDGDGVTLTNLGIDFDAIAHELGHHIIYRKLKSRDGESGVIHEGLADYFVYARTGNACLGESICPANSGACAVAGQCLRTGDNSWRLTDPNLSTEPHRRSQFLSGMLWDLGRQPGLDQDTVATLVIGAIDYLQMESGYTDLIKGLLSADLELFKGAHACAILDGANARGLQGWIQGLKCQDYIPASPG